VLPEIDDATRVFLYIAGIAKHVNVIAVLFGNELRCFESQVTTEAWFEELLLSNKGLWVRIPLQLIKPSTHFFECLLRDVTQKCCAECWKCLKCSEPRRS